MTQFIFIASLLLIFVVGTAFGSFINAVVYRIKMRKSILWDRSICTSCSKELGPLELIPVISYLFLKGKCSHCGKKISMHYMIFELITGFYFAGIGYFLLNAQMSPTQFVLYALLGISLLILSFSDILYLELPDELHPINIILGLLIAYTYDINLFFALFNGFLAGLLFFLVFKFTDGQKMGFGDVKLAFGLGVVFNFLIFVFIVMISSFLGIFYGILQSKFTNVKIDKVKVPYGAVLSITTLLFVIFSFTPIGRAFLNFYDVFSNLF